MVQHHFVVHSINFVLRNIKLGQHYQGNHSSSYFCVKYTNIIYALQYVDFRQSIKFRKPASNRFTDIVDYFAGLLETTNCFVWSWRVHTTESSCYSTRGRNRVHSAQRRMTWEWFCKNSRLLAYKFVNPSMWHKVHSVWLIMYNTEKKDW